MLSLGPMLIFSVGKIWDRAMPFILAAEIGVALAVPIGLVIARTRRLLRLGYGPDDIAAGIRGLFARQRDEFIFEHGATASLRERIFSAVGPIGLVVGVGIFAARAMGMLPHEGWVGFGLSSLYLGGIVTAVAKRFRRIRNGTSIWLRFWEGRWGRLLARVSGYRLGARAAAASANRPTEMAISSSAEAMFGSLSKETKKQLGDVPAVLRGLEAQAKAARARIEQLDSSIAEAKNSLARGAGGRGEELVVDLKAARTVAEARLSSVVAALENLRLDLLRLSAGAGGAEGVTRAIEAARLLGEDIERARQ